MGGLVKLALLGKTSLVKLVMGGLVKLTIPFSTSCGFEIEIDEGIDVFSEGKIKKGLLGGLSIESSHEHINWIKSFDNGEFRALFKNNLFSSKQLDKLLSMNPESKHTEFGKLHFVQASA